MNDLPSGWVRAPIGALCDLKNGMAFKPSDWSREGLKIIRIQNLNNPEALYNFYNGEIRDRFVIENGDLLFAWSGTPGTSFGAHIWRGERAVLNQHIFRVDFDEHRLEKRFFQYAINRKLAELINKAHGGAGLQHVTKGRFEETIIELAPLNEQRRIVAKIEELFSELDASAESLTRARAQLKTYRQSLLKAAFEGKFTADWRMADEFEFGSVRDLISRVSAQRDSRHERALNEWKATLAQLHCCGEQGRRPLKPRVADIAVTRANEFEALAALPQAWRWCLLSQLAGHIVDGTHKTPKYQTAGVAFISAKDIHDFRIDFSQTRFITQEEHEDLSVRCRVQQGNILITKSGTIGRVAVVETNVEFSLFESVANVPLSSLLNSRYVALASYFIIESFFGLAQQKGVAVRHLHLEDLRRLPIPICVREEQNLIVERVDAIFSSIAAMEAEIDAALAKISALRQSILKRAFSGGLVPQDPADESAAALLARLRAAPKPDKPHRKLPA